MPHMNIGTGERRGCWGIFFIYLIITGGLARTCSLVRVRGKFWWLRRRNFSLLIQMARVTLLADYSEDKKAISGRAFTKDQIRKVHAFAQPRPHGFSIRE